jgi:iron complex outermembrane receptor protein
VGNKEPSREDFTDSSPISRPKSESMTDIESGFKYISGTFTFGFNYYLMLYKNQLVPTGQLNDVGNYTRTNVKSSYREGYEFESQLKLTSKLNAELNATFSKNKIKKYVQFTDAYNAKFEYIGQKDTEYKNTTIAFSPDVIGSAQLSFEVVKDFKITLTEKYVSKQYLDNTSDSKKKLNAYTITNLQINYFIKPKFVKEIGFNITVYNLLNELYESNGYTWGYYVEEQLTNENFYYPQAGIHFIGQVSIKF